MLGDIVDSIRWPYRVFRIVRGRDIYRNIDGRLTCIYRPDDLARKGCDVVHRYLEGRKNEIM